MNTKRWIIFGIVCVAVLGGLIYMSRQNQIKVDVSALDANSVLQASNQNGSIADHTDGIADSKVKMIEYGDFQCTYCEQAYPGVKQVVADYKDKITFIFRNFPLTGNHPNALAAATAAEAASLQGKYWEMFDKLYQNQASWSNLSSEQRTNTFTSFAEDIGIDKNRLKTDMSSTAVSTKIAFDQELGKKVGVTGTPAIYINGKKISDDTYAKLVQNDTSNLRKEIDEALK